MISLFRWVEKIFKVGYKRTITEDDVFPIDPRLKSERLTALLEQSVDSEILAHVSMPNI